MGNDLQFRFWQGWSSLLLQRGICVLLAGSIWSKVSYGQIAENAASWVFGLTPVILVDGTSYGCAERLSQLSSQCHVPDLGTLAINHVNGQLTFKASRPLTLNGLGWEGETKLPGARAVLSNGFHSWSLSGIIAPQPAAAPQDMVKALDIRHDEFRSGTALSWDYSLISNDKNFLFVGATSAQRWKTWVQFSRKDQDLIGVRIMSGGAGEALVVDRDESISSETWQFHTGPLTALSKILETYGNSLIGPRSRHVPGTRGHNVSESQDRHQIPLGPTSRVGWNSWYNLWDKVDHQSFIDNVHQAATYISHQFSQVGEAAETPVAVLDDGWEIGWGDWRANKKFPDGLATVVKQIESAGMDAGIWIAPWLVAADSPLAKDKPGWFIGAEDFSHPTGQYKVLDPTHPEVAEHLRRTIKSLVSEGFKYLKLDFLYTGAFEGRRHKPVTALESFAIGMRIIREAAGPHVTLAACGAPGLATRPFVDSWRTGPDIAYQYPSGRPAWADVALQIQNLSARWFLCGSMRCDIDPLLVRGPRPIEEVHAALWAVALGGGGLFLSDDFRQLDTHRKSHSLDPFALNQAISETPGRPEPVLPDTPAAELKAVSWIDRFFDHSPVRAPLRWILPNGKKVFINTAEKTLTIDGIQLEKRTSHVD